MYKLTKKITDELRPGWSIGGNSVIDLQSGFIIPFDAGNTDYQAYLAWLAEGNTPLPADVVTGE